MPYDLMLLADPGPSRDALVRTLRQAPDLRPDAELESRFRLTTPRGEAQVNIGTKDPVESVHVEFEAGDAEFMADVALRTLDLARQLEMRVEDVQWGHEVTPESLPRLREHWERMRNRPAAEPAGPARPWWRFW